MIPTVQRYRQTVRRISIDGTIRDFDSIRACATENNMSIPRLKRLIEKKLFHTDGSRFELGPLVAKKDVQLKSVTVYLDPAIYGKLASESNKLETRPSVYIRRIVENHINSLISAEDAQPQPQSDFASDEVAVG